ncbi:MAG: response regulator [Spirochaetales bacterium]|nr:response regulator [Spirochaetales bacterium]
MNRSVLFVDDEWEILNAIKRKFRKCDFTILLAPSGPEGLKLLEENPIPVVVSDEKMPEMNGVEFLQEVKKLYPETIRIILSGYADSQTILNAINKGEVYRFITKPWKSEELLEIIEEAFEQHQVLLRNKAVMNSIIHENRQLPKDRIDRDFVLELTGDILESLPVPILVVGKDDRVIMFNSKMGARFSLSEGDSLDRIFPEDLKDRILKGFSHPGGQEGFPYTLQDREVAFMIRSLRTHDHYQGLLIMDESL